MYYEIDILINNYGLVLILGPLSVCFRRLSALRLFTGQVTAMCIRNIVFSRWTTNFTRQSNVLTCNLYLFIDAIEWAVIIVLLFNIAEVIYSYTRRANNFETLPLTPSQRALLGLEPVASKVPGEVPIFKRPAVAVSYFDVSILLFM